MNTDTLQEMRVEVCRTTSAALDHCGRVLWCFGLTDIASRRAIGIATQIAGELGKAATTLLEANGAYAAAALLRQIVEVEYLLYLFGADPNEVSAWLGATEKELRDIFQPAAMRRRSGNRFRDTEYKGHCITGGHPHPHGARLLLNEHQMFAEPQLKSREWLWWDLAQHLGRVWDQFHRAVAAHGLVEDIAAVRANVADVSPLLRRWRELDKFEGAAP